MHRTRIIYLIVTHPASISMVKQAAALFFKSKLGRYLYISKDDQNVSTLIPKSMGIPTYIREKSRNFHLGEKSTFIVGLYNIYKQYTKQFIVTKVYSAILLFLNFFFVIFNNCACALVFTYN